jgi:hypothetical protein
MRGDLTEVTSPDEIVTDLRVLTARRADLMGDWVHDINRIRELLASIFPRWSGPSTTPPVRRWSCSLASKLQKASGLPALPAWPTTWLSTAPGVRAYRPWWTKRGPLPASKPSPCPQKRSPRR